ncbi:FtsX-like permease family protein [Acetobacter thailandicus]|uniref:FtsX-like permease family protein n=1 Tax=Acetobacter thailandicus TaxID=1502842 RepID=UPI001BA66EB4|nr:FtsX-like permease family protein [Acetobacter thailandicus]MBS0961377.1 ABC transporter permease [Acetobacter thailandicus]
MLSVIFDGVLRQARRHPLHSMLNILGLAVGIGVFLTLTLLVRYDYSYNTAITDVDRIVRVDSEMRGFETAALKDAATPFVAVPFLKQDFPEIEETARVSSAALSVKIKGEFASFTGYEVDPSFFHLFSSHFLHGSADTALARPEGLVLSEAAALRLFGTTDVLGRQTELYKDGQKTLHTVTAVLSRQDKPDLFSDAEMFISIPEQEIITQPCFKRWGSMCGPVYLKLHSVDDISTINARLEDFLIRHASGTDKDEVSLGAHPEKHLGLYLLPLRKQYFYDMIVQNARHYADQNVVNSIGLIGLLALILACTNTVNLATAQATLRAREVAVRKTLGASGRQLFIQFMGEACLNAMVAGLFGLALCEVLTPIVASLSGEVITVRYSFVLTLWPVIILMCGLLSGVYPALVLSHYRPAAILAATRMPAGGRLDAKLRHALVIAQFTIAITIVICTRIIDQQTSFVRHADKGYNMSGLLVGSTIETDDLTLQRKIFSVLSQVPGVKSITFSQLKPNPELKNYDIHLLKDGGRIIKVKLLSDTVSPGYFETYQPKLLAGRWFDQSHGQDEAPVYDPNKKDQYNVVINAVAARRYGFAKPIDAIDHILSEEGNSEKIIGVIDDIRFFSPYDAIHPQIIYYHSLNKKKFFQPVPSVRFSGAPEAEMAQRLDRAMASVLPDSPSQFQSAQAHMEDFYKGDERRGKIFTLGAAAALLIACLGLYSLASFTTLRRVYEIGIRKTLGATAHNIIFMLLRDFLNPVLISCAIAVPVAWFAMRSWLSGFDQRIALNPLLFLVPVAGALIIAALTVLGQTIRVARSEPSRALRAE